MSKTTEEQIEVVDDLPTFWLSPAHKDVSIKVGNIATEAYRELDSLVLTDIKDVLHSLETELSEAAIGDGYSTWMIRVKRMTQEEIDDMGEFEGW